MADYIIIEGRGISMGNSYAKKFINFDSQYILSKMGYAGFRFLVGLRCKDLGLLPAYIDLTILTIETENDQPPALIFAALPASPSYEEIESAIQRAANTFSRDTAVDVNLE